jgi:putative ABC transport system permease protein
MPECFEPPRGAVLLLSFFWSDPEFPQILGDLFEEFQERVGVAGETAARRWYWRESLRNAWALTRRGVFHRPVRFGPITLVRGVATVLLLGLPVALILFLAGLSEGMLQDSARRTRGIGADIVIRPKNSGLLTLSGAPLPLQAVMYLRTWPHVKVALGVVNQPIQTPLVVTGVDLEQFNRMSGGFRYLEGGPFRRPDDILIDRFYAAQRKLKAGDTLNLLNRDWHVAGVIEGGKLARIVLPLKALQELTGNAGRFSQIYLKLDDPANTASVIAALKTRFEDFPIYSMDEMTSLYTADSVSGLREFLMVALAIVAIVSFAVVCLSTYVAVLQRGETGPAGVLGVRLVFAEAEILSLGGAVAGILMSLGLGLLVRRFVPASLPFLIVSAWWPLAGAFTLAGGLLGAIGPAVRSLRRV